MTNKMFDEWWTSAKMDQMETKKPDLWEEIQENMDDIKVYVMDDLQASTTKDDIASFADDIGLSGLYKSRFTKACVALAASRTPSANSETETEGSEPYKVQSGLVTASINTDTKSVDDEDAEGLVKEAQDMPSQTEQKVDHNEVDTEVNFGVQVDAQSKWLNNENKEESVKHAYPDLSAKKTVKDLEKKMREYLYAPDIEEYIIYTDESRTKPASQDSIISDIAIKDEKNQMYTLYAKKKFKTVEADQSKVDALAEKMVVSSEVLAGLVSGLDHVDEQINCYVADLAVIFGKFEDDPVLKTLLSICRFKNQTKQNRKEQTERKIEMAKKNVQAPGPDALSQVMMYGGMAGTGMGMMGGLCSLYSWKQDRKINKWETVKANDKKEYKEWKKKNGSSPKKRAEYRAKKAATNKKIASAEGKKSRMGKVSGGIQALGFAMQAASLGMQIYQMVEAAKKRKEALQKHADEMSAQINACANSFESSALIYDNLVSVLWNIKEMLYMAFKKELDEKAVFEKFMDEQSKPTMAKYKHQIVSKDGGGKPQALFDLKNAVAEATRTVISYLSDLALRYVEMRTRLDSKKFDMLKDIKATEKDLEEEKDPDMKTAYQKILDKKMAEINGQSLRKLFDSFLEWKAEMSGDDVLVRGTQNDLLELYYNAFLVYTFQTVGAEEGSPYGKYNINPQIDMDTAVLEILDKDNLLKNDLLFSQFFDPKEFDIDKYIADELQKLSGSMKTLAFVRVARARYMIFSSYKSRKDEKTAISDEKKAKKLNRAKPRSDEFQKYSFTLLLFLMKVYKQNPVENIKYIQ